MDLATRTVSLTFQERPEFEAWQGFQSPGNFHSTTVTQKSGKIPDFFFNFAQNVDFNVKDVSILQRCEICSSSNFFGLKMHPEKKQRNNRIVSFSLL